MKILLIFLLIATSSAIKLTCNFNRSTNWAMIGGVYTCTVTSFDFSDNSHDITSISGSHLSGKSNSDVKMIFFGGVKNGPRFHLSTIPKKFTNFFPNFIALQLQSSGIDFLSGDELNEYKNLQWYVHSNTEIEAIPGNLFSHNFDMRYIQFQNNKIKRIGSGLFDNLRNLASVSFLGNICINASASTQYQLNNLNSMMSEQCPELKTTTIKRTTEAPSTTPNPNLSVWPKDDPRWESDEPNYKRKNIPKGPTEEYSKSFWNNKAQSFLKEKLNVKLNNRKAKNVVIFIGDGMGLPSVMAARSYIRDPSEELSFEKFPFSGLSKTYAVNYQVVDSAASATAILTGVKINNFMLSLTADVTTMNCSASKNKEKRIDSIFKHAQDAGKATGVVTTTRITHATPAAAYCHSALRLWEVDSLTPEGCEDIAFQLIHGEVGEKLNVKMGGGAENFRPKSENGLRNDNRNLIKEFIEKAEKKGETPAVLFNKTDLESFNTSSTDKLLGLFAQSHLQYKILADDKVQPTLTEITAKALEVLEKNKNGFVLLVEGGMIDNAHHENMAHRAIAETVEFHEAVKNVKEHTNEEETLIVVTSDHSHPFSVGGFMPRSFNVLGPADYSYEDNMWAFGTNYAFGPGHYDHFEKTGGRKNPRGMNYMDPNFKHPAMIPMDQDPHSGEDVAVYASGPQAHLFTGTFEQNYIAHALMYASCIGPKEFLKNSEC